MKKLAAVLVLLLAVSGTAHALSTEDLVALVAMPLAVAAVADMAGVPTHDLVQVVSAMNRAAVPPPQFIEVVRYVPVALVDDREPRFTTYVTREVDRGVRGQQLAVVMADRLDTYGVREINVVNPPVVHVVERNYIPPMVVTRVEQRRIDPLALVAMPLAVAAAAELTGVPRNDLFSLVAALNRAAVPAPQFVEIVRYSPVALVDPRFQPQFVTFVDTSIDRGLVGLPLALAIDERFRTWGVDEIRVLRPVEPVRILERREYLPTTVYTRVAQVTGHPHGGPPGQLKRDLGLQTGAEVVHGTHPGQGSARSAPAARSVEVRERPAQVTTERRAKVERGPSAKAQKQKPAQARENRSQPAQRSAPAAKKGGPPNDNRGKGSQARVERRPDPPQAQASPQGPKGKGKGGGGAAQGNPNAGGGKGQGQGKGKGGGR